MATDAAMPPAPPAEASELTDWQGRVVDGRFCLDEMLGTGATGVVYRAEDLEGHQPVAVKILAAEGHQTVSRFEREGRTTSRLAHPNIVETVCYGVSEGTPYLAMELLEGRTLEQLLEEDAPLGLELAFDIGRQILEGVAYAHRMGVVHRDLKPANVFLEDKPDGAVQVKLLDFGLAKLLSPDATGLASTLTLPGMVMGTPLYMAPEQATGAQVDCAADVYAVGAVLFEVLTGRPPFLADDHSGLIKAHLLEPVPAVSKQRRDLPVPEGFDALIGQAMAKEPAARFADGQVMLEAWAVLQTQAAQAASRSSQLPRAWQWLQQSRVRLGLAAALLLALGYLLLSPVIGDSDTSAARGHSDRGALPPPQDVWSSLGVPEALSEYYAKVEAGQGVDRNEMRIIQQYARDNPTDARPYLLLGRGFSNRYWRKDAVQRYLWAFRADASSRGDPHMLKDLLAIAAHDTHGDLACEAIAEIFGSEASSEVRRELRRAAPGSAQAERLKALAERVTAR